MPKVVVNRCYGGFGLSPKALVRVAEKLGRECYFARHIREFSSDYSKITLEKFEIVPAEQADMWTHAFSISDAEKAIKNWNEYAIPDFQEDRSNPILVEVVEELGEEADGDCAKLEVVQIPDDVDWYIDEYDGMEHVAERHQKW